MDQPEPQSQSFIVKVWIEKTGARMRHATWRGHITDVFSGKRRYLKELNGITSFIEPYLRAMGVKVTRRARLTSFLKRYLFGEK